MERSGGVLDQLDERRDLDERCLGPRDGRQIQSVRGGEEPVGRGERDGREETERGRGWGHDRGECHRR